MRSPFAKLIVSIGPWQHDIKMLRSVTESCVQYANYGQYDVTDYSKRARQ